MGRLDFLYSMELPHRAVSVYIYLYDRANKNGECWPAIPTIAKRIKALPINNQESFKRFTESRTHIHRTAIPHQRR